jgi:hypothetical protein
VRRRHHKKCLENIAAEEDHKLTTTRTRKVKKKTALQNFEWRENKAHIAI